MNEEECSQDLEADQADPQSSGSLLQTFSTPFNWCDRRCERCPLADECTVNRREQQRRWVHEARGEDPDSLAVALSDVKDELARALVMAREIAIEKGPDPDAPLPPMPISLDEVKLQRAGLELAVALRAALDAQHAGLATTLPAAIVDDAMTASATLGAKCARIVSYLAERHGDTWTADAVPNLLLMERLRVQLDDALTSIEAGLGALRLEEVRAAKRDLDRILDPLFASIHPGLRRLLEGLVARGAAPSPFSILEPATG